MRRVYAGLTLALTLVLAGASAAYADPSPAASGLPIPVPSATPATTVCTVSSDSKGAIYMTGLVALPNGGYAAVDERNSEWPMYVAVLNSKCQRQYLISYPGGAHDPEDLAIDKNGVLWVADIGDPAPQDRPDVWVWKVDLSTKKMTKYQFKYPDAPHPAKAMVLDTDGRPIFITQPNSGSGPATLYEPASGTTLKTGTDIPLQNVGTFNPEATGTANKLSITGNTLVTGGATATDGSKVVLRTYSDAYEWTITDSDVATTIAKGTPVITPMPNEPQGETIAFTADGKDFLTVSNVTTKTPIMKYAPAAPVPVAKAAKSSTKTKAENPVKKWLLSLSKTDLELLLLGIALFGLLLIVAGALGIRRSRRRAKAAAAAERKAAKAEKARATVGAAAPGGVYGRGGGGAGPGGVYGAPISPPPSGGGGVYGGGVSGPPGGSPGPGGGGTVYGGGGQRGGVYGSPRGAEPQGGDPYGPDPYGADPYGADPYGADPYGPQDPYGAPPPRGGVYGSPHDPYGDEHGNRRR